MEPNNINDYLKATYARVTPLLAEKNPTAMSTSNIYQLCSFFTSPTEPSQTDRKRTMLRLLKVPLAAAAKYLSDTKTVVCVLGLFSYFERMEETVKPDEEKYSATG